MSTLKDRPGEDIDQLPPRYGVVEDTDPGETPTLQSGNSSPFQTILTGNGTPSHTSLSIHVVPPTPPVKRNYRKPTPTKDNYGPTRIQQRLEKDASANPQLAGRRCIIVF